MKVFLRFECDCGIKEEIKLQKKMKMIGMM